MTIPRQRFIRLDLLDLLPWRGQGPQQQLFDGFPPTVPITWISCSGVDCHAHVFAIRSHHVNPSFLWPSSPSLSMDISVKCNLWVSSLCPGNDAKLIRCVLGTTLNSSVVVQGMTVKLRPCLRFRACGWGCVRWKVPCRKGCGWFVKLTWLALLSLYYIL